MIKIINLKKALEKDSIEQFVNIDKKAFINEGNQKNTWTKENFLLPLPKKFDFSYAIFVKESLIGYSICYKCNEDWAHISRVAINPLFQRQGFGEKLLKSQISKIMDKETKIITIELNKENNKAENFYSNVGFKRLNQEELSKYIYIRKRIPKEYFGKGACQIVMIYNPNKIELDNLFIDKEKNLNENCNTSA